MYKRQVLLPGHDPSRAAALARNLATQGIEVRRAEAPLTAVSYTHLRAHETVLDLVCRLLLEKKQDML